jgi:hypothetical protein
MQAPTFNGTRLERAARMLWAGDLDGYMKFTVCNGCDEFKACRSKHGTRYLCLPCYDQGAR